MEGSLICGPHWENLPLLQLGQKGEQFLGCVYRAGQESGFVVEREESKRFLEIWFSASSLAPGTSRGHLPRLVSGIYCWLPTQPHHLFFRLFFTKMSIIYLEALLNDNLKNEE